MFLGDLVDRGPGHPGRAAAGDGHGRRPATRSRVPGNHENKLLRALRGRKVQVTHGLAESLAQLAAEPAEFRAAVERFSTGWSATTCSTAGGSWSRTPG